MDDFYRSVETSLLTLGLVLGIAVAVLVTVPRGIPDLKAPITLPMIEVFAGD